MAEWACRGAGSCRIFETVSKRSPGKRESLRPYTTLHILHGPDGHRRFRPMARRQTARCSFAAIDFQKSSSIKRTFHKEEHVIDKETMSHPRFMTVSEAAELLHLAPDSLYALVSERRIPYRKAGRRLLFLESELIEWTRPIERKRRFSGE